MVMNIFGFQSKTCRNKEYIRYSDRNKKGVAEIKLKTLRGLILYTASTLAVKTADILQCHQWLPSKMTQHRNSVLTSCHYPDQVSDMSSKWNFCNCSSDVIAWRNHW